MAFTHDTALAAARKRIGQPVDRFWSKVEKSGGCWNWRGKTNAKGYGVFVVAGNSILVHRYAYALANGAIPIGALVCHRCDNPPCVNPEHLFAGTSADNARDRNFKGRAAPKSGSKNGRAKLTPAVVAEIRDRYGNGLLQRELGAIYGVGQTQISKIVRGTEWCAK